MNTTIFHNEIELTDSIIDHLIGHSISKISNKPFSTGKVHEIITEIVPNYIFPHGKKLNAVIIDNKPVELRRCIVSYSLQKHDMVEFYDTEMDINRVVGVIDISGEYVIVDSNETDGYQTQKVHISNIKLFNTISNIILT